MKTKNPFTRSGIFVFTCTKFNSTCVWLFFIFGILLFTSFQVEAQKPVLKHSYTFDDGTAADVVGEADGVIKGGGQIIDGLFLTYKQGQYIELPSYEILINQYSSISLEAFIIAPRGNPPFTMISYFGRNTGAFGADYLFQSVDNNGQSLTSISCTNISTPFISHTAIGDWALVDDHFHHLVTTFDNHLLKLYIDGVLRGVRPNYSRPFNVILSLSNELAYLCKSGFTADPTWNGAIDEFNIYEGILDSATISSSANNYHQDPKRTKKTYFEVLAKLPDQNPGFRPESELAENFIKNYKKAKFMVYPTIVRIIDTKIWSAPYKTIFYEPLRNDLELNVRPSEVELDPGELTGNNQFDFFNGDMKNLAAGISDLESDANYNVVMEVLFASQQPDTLKVYGMNIFILNNEGENVYSFLLNSHHNLFTNAHLFETNPNAFNRAMLMQKCTMVAINALKLQIESSE
ncbi:LamG domain-containing protein [Maribellus mangrovi]|uniref:LamG domain-containing protein n=1 Tax=Maribellus mangrovi TaxID=3133146 RepID=UPI0030EE6061